MFDVNPGIGMLAGPMDRAKARCEESGYECTCIIDPVFGNPVYSYTNCFRGQKKKAPVAAQVLQPAPIVAEAPTPAPIGANNTLPTTEPTPVMNTLPKGIPKVPEEQNQGVITQRMLHPVLPNAVTHSDYCGRINRGDVEDAGVFCSLGRFAEQNPMAAGFVLLIGAYFALKD